MKTVLTLASLSLSAKVLHINDQSEHQWIAELKDQGGHLIERRAYATIKEAGQAALAHITFDASIEITI